MARMKVGGLHLGSQRSWGSTGDQEPDAVEPTVDEGDDRRWKRLVAALWLGAAGIGVYYLLRNNARAEASPSSRAVLPAGGKTISYTVVRGDTLSSIARKLLGDPCYWPVIYDLNRETLRDPENPDRIAAGDVLVVPSKGALEKVPEAVRAEIIRRCFTHRELWRQWMRAGANRSAPPRLTSAVTAPTVDRSDGGFTYRDARRA